MVRTSVGGVELKSRRVGAAARRTMRMTSRARQSFTCEADLERQRQMSGGGNGGAASRVEGQAWEERQKVSEVPRHEQACVMAHWCLCLVPCMNFTLRRDQGFAAAAHALCNGRRDVAVPAEVTFRLAPAGEEGADSGMDGGVWMEDDRQHASGRTREAEAEQASGHRGERGNPTGKVHLGSLADSGGRNLSSAQMDCSSRRDAKRPFDVSRPYSRANDDVKSEGNHDDPMPEIRIHPVADNNASTTNNSICLPLERGGKRQPPPPPHHRQPLPSTTHGPAAAFSPDDGLLAGAVLAIATAAATTNRSHALPPRNLQGINHIALLCWR
ncbi:hypothetical protein KC352_g1 [Hortaea werneckii]|nr:hypothetical protein KC352_g1 [Hortaea werneckii]